MTAPRPRWIEAPVPDTARTLEEAGYPAWQAAMLARRNLSSPEEAERFLNPSLDHLVAPSELREVDAAVQRLLEARSRGEKVAVVGDYDVDGITGTAQLAAVFRACGVEVHTILPERLREGYGLQSPHVVQAHELGCGLIVTIDCGSSAHGPIGEALEREIDVIVADHHLAEQPLPTEVVEINPHRGTEPYPHAALAAAGIAFKLAVAFAAACERPIDPRALLRMACLGTIADLVPLVGENRTIASLGLEALRDTRSPGLRSLMENARLRPPFRSEDVGFRIGPRINAAGRMGSPQAALELLMTRDPGRGRTLANQLEEANQVRKGAQDKVVREARQQIEELEVLPPVLALWNPDWHRGVVGIAAGQIARRYGRPTVLLGVDGDLATGSGRSVPGIHLRDFLLHWGDELERFGGHAQAVGLTVRTGELPRLRDEWTDRAGKEWPPEALVPRLEYEGRFSPEDLNLSLYRELHRMEPFGIGNRAPRLRTGPLQLAGPPRLFGKGHLSAQATSTENGSVGLLGWHWEERKAELDGTFDAVGVLEFDTYRNCPVFRLDDVRPHTGEPAEQP